MVLTVSFVLSPVTGLFCHRHQRTNVVPKPGRADITSANLTPASGCQDHTTSPYAAIVSRPRAVDRSQAHHPPCNPVARKTLPRPPHPHPASVTIAIRPLWWDGMREVLEVIWGVWEWKYFCKGDSTAVSLICPSGKSADGVESKFSRVPHAVQRSSRRSATSNSASICHNDSADTWNRQPCAAESEIVICLGYGKLRMFTRALLIV
jgi:hypothetical protein